MKECRKNIICTRCQGKNIDLCNPKKCKGKCFCNSCLKKINKKTETKIGALEFLRHNLKFHLDETENIAIAISRIEK